MEAYLDNSATTKCSQRAMEVMNKVLVKDYGNPSSMHHMGVAAEDYEKAAKEKIARTLRVGAKEIYFTSGGTEANNLAILGTAMANKRSGTHIITTGIEHASVYETVRYLEEQGFRVTYLPVDAEGVIRLEDLEQAVGGETTLVSIMQVNNEIGAVEPIAEAAKLIHGKNKNTLIHVDAIQSYGKMKIRPRKLGIDLLSVSGHKIHGPKGSGFLYIREKTKIKPILFGGGQQGGLRSGTENVPAIAGLGEAAAEIYEDFPAKIARLYELRERFIKEVCKIDGVSINGKAGKVSPHIVSMSVEGVRSEVLLHALEEKHIYVSAGSACSSNRPAVSRTLKGIGLKQELLNNTIRVSFSVHTTMEEVLYALEALEEEIPLRQKYTRK